ncbi:MAG: Ig-like domain-containing protein [Ruminococcus sp.]
MTVTKGKTTSVKSDSSWKNVKYSTSNKKVATVDKKGKVKAVAAGTVKITVKSGSQKAVHTIVVPGTTAIKGVKIFCISEKGQELYFETEAELHRKSR